MYTLWRSNVAGQLSYKNWGPVCVGGLLHDVMLMQYLYRWTVLNGLQLWTIVSYSLEVLLAQW